MEYSEIIRWLELEKDKTLTNEHAYLTHYLQSSKNGSSSIFKDKALAFIASKIENGKSLNWGVPFPPPAKSTFSFIDLFAGIGGFRIAMQNVGGRCVFSSEIDNAAKKTYESNYGEFPFGDIREFTGPNVTDKQLDKLIPDHDVLAGGFPCQPFSLAGVSARNYLGQASGFSDLDKGNLFFDIARIVAVKKPSVVFLENVKNFKGHDGGNTYLTVKKTFEDLDYTFYSDTINAASWVPQKRQRFYMVCFKKEPKRFVFPTPNKELIPLRTILEKDVDARYTISDKLWEGHQRRSKANKDRGTGFTTKVADLDKPANTLVARYGKDGKECLVPQDGLNPRMLTPRECARLQGFPETFILPETNPPAYRQFGNSVAVPVIEAIATQIVKTLKAK